MTLIRTRWAAIGAAVAVTLGAGGIGLTQAAVNSGPKPVFVAVTPCRLVDTRPGDANIGGRTSPLAANDTLTLEVTGSTGQCKDIPADAVAAALNVTAIRPTAQSFLSVYPADAALPNASNLNWAAGDPPTPNKVDVKLSGDGKIKMTNSVGEVHVAADLVGYYTDHTHDDRYYTKNQTDTKLDGKADTGVAYTKAQADAAIAAAVAAALAPANPVRISFADLQPQDPTDWDSSNGWTALSAGCLFAPFDVPAGTDVSSIDVTYRADAPTTFDAGVVGLRTTAGSAAPADATEVVLFNQNRPVSALTATTQAVINVTHEAADLPPGVARGPVDASFDYTVVICADGPMTVVAAAVNLG